MRTVQITNEISDSLEIQFAIPQGSVLRSILCLIYIKNWDKFSKIITLLYADDITLC